MQYNFIYVFLLIIIFIVKEFCMLLFRIFALSKFILFINFEQSILYNNINLLNLNIIITIYNINKMLMNNMFAMSI